MTMRSVRWIIENMAPPAVALALVLWLMIPERPTEIYGIYAETPWVKPGGDLKLRFVGFRNRPCPVESMEEIQDASGRIFRTPSRLGNPELRTGIFDAHTITQVPAEAAKGWAIFRSFAVYGIDPWHGCFRSWRIGAPERPDVRFWIGDEPPLYMQTRRAD
jgi:hypothetical protein